MPESSVRELFGKKESLMPKENRGGGRRMFGAAKHQNCAYTLITNAAINA